MVKLMTQDVKDRIRDLEGQKVLLEDSIEFENRPVQLMKLEQELYEIEDTIRKLTA
jgi:hypothetical protein